jgi:transposase
MRVLYQRCAGIDVHKDQVTVAVRLPGSGPGGRDTGVRKFAAVYGVLREMTRWLVSQGVTHVAMEATGVYTLPVYHALLEPGIRAGAGVQRRGAVLQDAGIKLDLVASSIDTVSGLAMIRALIDGERRGAVLADLARGVMRSKISDLSLALEGRFDDHHALMCQLHLDHIAHLGDMIAQLDSRVETMMVPFRPQRDLLATIPGIGPIAAAAIISEIGTSPAEYFTTAAHLASWAGLCPGNHESAGKRKHGKPRKASQHLQPLGHKVTLAPAA